MKVLIVSNINSKQPYGSFTRPFFIGRELKKYCDIFHVGYDCAKINYSSCISTYSYSVLKYMLKVWKGIKIFSPDIIYSHENRPNLVCYLISLLNKKKIYIFDFHSSTAREYFESFKKKKRIVSRLIENMIIKSGNTIILASNYLKKVINEEYGKINYKKIHIVPNGAPEELINAPISNISPYKDYINKFIVLLIAPRNFYSNVEAVNFTIKVANIIKKNENILFVILGGGPKIEGPSNVIYMGYVDEIISYIDYADLCIAPYPKSAVSGGARNKVLDYFARKKIVLSTMEGVCGIEGAEHGKNVYISGDNEKEFAEAIINIINNREKYSNLGLEAFKLISDKYNWNSSGMKLFNILIDLMGKKQLNKIR